MLAVRRVATPQVLSDTFSALERARPLAHAGALAAVAAVVRLGALAAVAAATATIPRGAG